MPAKIAEIVQAAGNAGDNGFLELHINGECTLWDIERWAAPSILGRWRLSAFESNLVQNSGLVGY
jgi:hypothetical protein